MDEEFTNAFNTVYGKIDKVSQQVANIDKEVTKHNVQIETNKESISELKKSHNGIIKIVIAALISAVTALGGTIVAFVLKK